MFNYINNRFFELSSPYLDTGNSLIFFRLRLFRFFKFLLLTKKINKYFIVDLVIEIYFLITNIFFYPIALILKNFNFKIYIINNLSFGDFIHELSILKKKNSKQRIIMPTNNLYKFQDYQKTLFENTLVFKNYFINHLFLILGTYYFLNVNILNKNEILEPKHYFFNDNIFKDKKKLKEYLIYKKIVKTKISLKKSKFSDIRSFVNFCKKNKIAIINPRNVYGRNNNLRNSDAKNYLDVINFLNKKKFKIIIFDNFYSQKIIKKFNLTYIDLKKTNNKLKQICAFEKCSLYVGSYSGMGHLTDLFKTRSLYTDEVFFSGACYNPNAYVLPKKIYYKKKLLKFSKIQTQRKDSLFKDKNLKNIILIGNSSKEIKLFTKELINVKNLKKIKFFRNQYPLHCLINQIPLTYFNGNKNLFI